MTPLKAQAIQTALTGDWQNAIAINRELLKNNPDDIETLNRLAFAYSVLGKVQLAKDTYKTVLKLDSQNPIALKNLRRLSDTKKDASVGSLASYSPNNFDTMFIEETGKTKIIDLLNVAEPKVIAMLRTGTTLTLRIKRSKIFSLDQKGRYIGMLPEDLGRRLIKFMSGGNMYEAYVKAVQNHKVTIFLKETKRVSRFKNQPSFALTTIKGKPFPTQRSHTVSTEEEAPEADES